MPRWKKVKATQSCQTFWNSMDHTVHGILQNTGVGSPSLLQGIFPTQGSSPGLWHCRWIHNQLSHEGIPRILEWVAYPFSSGSSRHGDGNGVSCIAGRFFTNELSGKSKSTSLSGVCVCKWDIWYMWQVPRYVWICVDMHVCLSVKVLKKSFTI